MGRDRAVGQRSCRDLEYARTLMAVALRGRSHPLAVPVVPMWRCGLASGTSAGIAGATDGGTQMILRRVRIGPHPHLSNSCR